MDKTGIKKLLFAAGCMYIATMLGCASLPPEKEPEKAGVLALIDGEPVTTGDLEYSLQIAHRREKLSATKKLDIPQYVQKLIDDRLIVQEAFRMGIDRDPVIQGKISDYVLRESVVRLYNEEVVEKAAVTDEDSKKYFEEHFEVFTLDIIETSTEQDAMAILAALQRGEPFETYSRQYPSSLPREEGKQYVFSRNSMPASIRSAVDGLRTGEVSSVISSGDRYSIIKLLSLQTQSGEDLANTKKRIKNQLKNQKIKERSDAYLAQLRNEAGITVDRDLLASIRFTSAGERDQWLKDERVLAQVHDKILTAGEFTERLSSVDETAKEARLNTWVDHAVVDHEALSRQYDLRTDLKDQLHRYKSHLIKNAFIKNLVDSKISIADDEVKEYYANHQDDYLKPDKYKVQQITLKSEAEAQDVLTNLQRDANFSWLAKTRSVDTFAEKGGVTGWHLKSGLHDRVQEIIESLRPGDISPILEIDGQYRVIRLMEKTEKTVEPFSRVKALAHRSVYGEKFRKIYDEYIQQLRQEAKIEVDEEAVRTFENMFKK